MSKEIESSYHPVTDPKGPFDSLGPVTSAILLFLLVAAASFMGMAVADGVKNANASQTIQTHRMPNAICYESSSDLSCVPR